MVNYCRLPTDRPGLQRPRKRNVGFPVAAQFVPMLVFGTLAKHPVRPGFIALYTGVDHSYCFLGVPN